MSNDFYDSEMVSQQERLAKTPDMVRQREMLLRALSPRQGEAILELGSGNGILARDRVGRLGVRLPVSRACRTHRIAVATPTPNLSAAWRAGVPDSHASITLSRKS